MDMLWLSDFIKQKKPCGVLVASSLFFQWMFRQDNFCHHLKASNVNFLYLNRLIIGTVLWPQDINIAYVLKRLVSKNNFH